MTSFPASSPPSSGTRSRAPPRSRASARDRDLDRRLARAGSADSRAPRRRPGRAASRSAPRTAMTFVLVTCRIGSSGSRGSIEGRPRARSWLGRERALRQRTGAVAGSCACDSPARASGRAMVARVAVLVLGTQPRRWLRRVRLDVAAIAMISRCDARRSPRSRLEGIGVAGRRLAVPAHLPDVLASGGFDLAGRRRIVLVAEGSDASAHAASLPADRAKPASGTPQNPARGRASCNVHVIPRTRGPAMMSGRNPRRRAPGARHRRIENEHGGPLPAWIRSPRRCSSRSSSCSG